MNNPNNIHPRPVGNAAAAAAGGVVSDAEGDHARAQEQEEEAEQGQDSHEQDPSVNAIVNAGEPQQQQQQQMPPFPPSWLPLNNSNNNAASAAVNPNNNHAAAAGSLMIGPPQPPPPPPPSQHAIAMAQYYEARMRDHAAAYASAAAGAAWAAAQIAAQAAEFAASTHSRGEFPPLPPPPPPPPVPFDVVPPVLPMAYGPSAPNEGALYPGPPLGPPSAAVAAGGDPNMSNNNNNYYYANQNQNMNQAYPQPQPQYQEEQQEGGDWQNHHKRTNHYHHQEQHDYDDEANNLPDFDDYEHHNNNNNNDNDEYHAHRNIRRKRTQRRPPGGISIPQKYQNNSNNNNAANNNNNNNNTGSRVRRRLRDERSSNSSCCSNSMGTSITSYNSDQAMGGGNHNNNNNNHSSSNYAGNGNGNSSSSGGRGGGGGGNYYRGGGRRSGSGSGNQHYHRYKKKQRQRPSDGSLLGKTAVAALHEWCDKRRMGQPSFALLSQVAREGGIEFETAVYMEDNEECGRGRGTSKISSKQDAARKALVALLPGVVFDPESGILVELPSTSSTTEAAIAGRHRTATAAAAASLEDLAPHLAQRLAIASGRDDDNDDYYGNKNSASRPRAKLKRVWQVYPGTTSTTNSEEDYEENAWYASRGASVWSALLHAMVQIDDRIPEIPQYMFAMSELQTANAQMKRKGPASSSCSSAIVIHRGSFTCTATLKVLSSSPTERAINDGESNNDSSPSSDTRARVSSETTTKEAATTSSSVTGDSQEEPKDTEAKQKADQSKAEKSDDGEDSPNEKQNKNNDGNTQVKVLEAVGVGGTKRESKHTASAKLLALLFPECKTMVEVKAAAEAQREDYAANKSKKNNSSRSRSLGNAGNHRLHSRRDRSKIPRLSLSQLSAICTPGDNEPPLPDFYTGELQAFLGIQQKEKPSVCSQVMGFEKLNINVNQDCSSDKPQSSESTDETNKGPKLEQTSMSRQVSRQKQLEEKVDKALQALNEHDEEGRSLPEELTVDDVGRTLLRRAETEDIERIRRLLRNNGQSAGYQRGQPPPVAILGAAASDTGAESGNETSEIVQDDGAVALRLWGSSTIVLLLCRAIAAFEDPPLGCAVLTLGFSMKEGRLLRIAQMGSEPHLPRERFLECLDAFATCMNCTLDAGQQDQQSGVRLQKRDLEAIVESHLGARTSSTSIRANEAGRSANFSAPLQSVLEESEGGDDSERSTDAAGKVKGQDKPSKRSRVE